jgi:hypothetical protein
MKKIKWLSVILIAVMLLMVGFVVSFITAFYGNPITEMIVTSKIRSYVEETYPDLDLEVTKAVYNFKFQDYVSRVQSKTSVDTGFSVSWEDKTIHDTYENDVVKHYRTYERLQMEFSEIVEDTVGREFPYETYILFADFDKSMDDFSSLTLDMPLNTGEIPVPVSLTIYFYHDKINYEVFCDRLLELYDIMNKNNIRMDYYSVVMEEPPTKDEKTVHNGESIYLYDYPADRLASDHLIEDIKAYMAMYEKEHEK